jgi:hypothetical protein
MKTINITQPDTPIQEDVVALLNAHFESSGYNCYIFGKSIMVKKDAFVAARVYIIDNKRKIIVRGSFGITYLAIVPFFLFIATIFSFFKNITNETYSFLFEQYGS